MCRVNSKQVQVVSLLISLHFMLSCSSTERTVTVNDSCKTTYDTLTNQTVYIFVDEMPEYPGGIKEALIFFLENFKYPQQDVYQGSFQLEFIVDMQGNVTGQRIRNKNTSELTEADKEALRVLSIMPKWKPGKCKGEAVPFRTNIPIKL